MVLMSFFAKHAMKTRSCNIPMMDCQINQFSRYQKVLQNVQKGIA